MPYLVQRIIEFFVDKKKLVGWISAIGIAIAAAAVGMSSKDFKDAVCSAPLVSLPSGPAVASPTPVEVLSK